MKLKKKILPFAFLGLSPTAVASQTAPNSSEDIKNSATTEIVSDSINATSDKSTYVVNVMDIIPSDTLTAQESNKIIDDLILRYNKKPDAFRIEDIYKLMTFMQNPSLFYNKLNMPVNQAKALSEIITPQLLNKIGISDKKDILVHSANKNVTNISDSEAFSLATNKEIMDLIKDKEKIYSKALNSVLSNSEDILQNQNKKDLIINSLNYSIENQNNDNAISLYIKIFEYTTKVIHDFYNIGEKEKTFELIRWLSNCIDEANKKISVNTKMDKIIAVRIPSEAVVKGCNQSFNKLGLTKIYNDAYYAYLKTGTRNYRMGYTSKNAHRIFQAYLSIIYLQHKPLNQKEQEELAELLKAYPESKLFDKYFSIAYLDMGNRDKIDYFAAKLNSSAGSKKAYPKEIKESINNRAEKIKQPIEMMKENGILVPDFDADKTRINYTDFIHSDLSINVIFNKINDMLEQQINLIKAQEQTAKQLQKLQKEKDDDTLGFEMLVQRAEHIN